MDEDVEMEDHERIGLDLFEQLADLNRSHLLMLHAAINVVFWVLNQAPDEEKHYLCDEARADLDETIKAVLTPDSVFEAREKRAQFKIVRNPPDTE